eukprot:365684-Chlamydomonas_euryale.AAC.13
MSNKAARSAGAHGMNCQATSSDFPRSISDLVRKFDLMKSFIKPLLAQPHPTPSVCGACVRRAQQQQGFRTAAADVRPRAHNRQAARRRRALMPTPAVPSDEHLPNID